MRLSKQHHLLVIFSSLLLLQAFATDYPEEAEIVQSDFQQSSEESRNLASYPNIRIALDFEHVTDGDGDDDWKQYLTTQLLPSIANYYRAALKVRHPLTSKISTTKTSLCGLPTPQALKTGIDADIVFFFNTKYDASGSWLAATTICTMSSSNGVTKPQIVNIGINSKFIDVANPIDNPLTHDLNIITLAHEFIHGFAMTGSLYKYFVDQNNTVLTNHIQTLTINGESRTVLDLPPLTTRLRNFYGCNTVPGVIMENDGGAHLERRYYQWEVMSSGGLIGSKISEVSLGFLEGSGWYAPDYSYAEPYFFGKGEGCGFIYNSCDPATFNEFCDDSRGCNSHGESGGNCNDDSKSEGCKFYISTSYLNCENPKGIYYTTLASKQVYGRGLGSKCFAGNLTSSKTAAASPMTYCFTYDCIGTGSSTVLKVNFGTTSFNCTERGNKSVSGYYGFVNCPDPVEFCTTIGKPFCPKNCLGQGTCVNGKCQCDAGYQGTDCGFTI